MKKVRKCSTGIEELDYVIGGGFPCGGSILVAGNPGAGKTTLGAKFVYEGARRYGEPGVYLSFIEPRSDFMKFMGELRFNFEELEKEDMFSYIEGIQTTTPEGAMEALEEFIREILRIKAKRAVIDSMTALTQIVGFRHTRELIKNTIVNGLKPYNVTTILISELPLGTMSVGYGIEEFLVDGVIILKSAVYGGMLIRKMEIRKMRGTSIPFGELHFDIVPKKGISIYLPLSLEEIPGPSEETTYPIPNKKLGEIIGGNLPIWKGTQMAIVANHGVPALMLILCLVGALVSYYGGPLIVRSYTKPPKTILNMLKYCGCCFNYTVKPTQVIVNTTNPTTRPIYALGAFNRVWDLKIKPKFLVFDTLNTVIEVSGDKETYLREHINNLFLRRKLGITSFYIYTADLKRETIPGLDLYDAVVYLDRAIVDSKICIDAIPLRMPPPLSMKPIRICMTEKGFEFLSRQTNEVLWRGVCKE
jgi:circadian clock protein KaiC